MGTETKGLSVEDKRSGTSNSLVQEHAHVIPTYAEVVKKPYVAKVPSKQSTTRKDILAREAHSLERIQ
jgi:hypothetical protein